MAETWGSRQTPAFLRGMMQLASLNLWPQKDQGEPRSLQGLRVWKWKAQALSVTWLLPAGHTGTLGNITGQEGLFAAGSCVTSLERIPSCFSGEQLLGGDLWRG